MPKDRKFFCLACFIAIVTVLLCFLTLGQFVIFLSAHTSLNCFYTYSNSENLKNTFRKDSAFMNDVIIDLILLVIFAIQHSIQAHIQVKHFLHRKGYDVFERLSYNFGSCIALQIVMWFWRPIPSMVIWEISTSHHPVWWWLFSIIHFLAWLVTYSGCFIMDITELLGIRQVYHYIQDWPHPLVNKSDGLKRFYSHMRHPSFSAVVVVLFVHPVMQIDRLLIACMFTVYMIVRFKVDDHDYAYQKRMLQRKYRDLCLDS